MRLGGHSGSGKLGITILSLLVSSGVHADAVTADGFGRVIQQMVKPVKLRLFLNLRGVCSQRVQFSRYGRGIAVAAEVIRERPDVFDSIRMLARKWVTSALHGTSVFAALMAFAKHTIDDSISTVFQVLAVI
ncbi:hypothetical protein AL526_024635 [Citrobacter koseri]|nr:hypothetical protein AL526_024635 [Citrobacter koseri]